MNTFKRAHVEGTCLENTIEEGRNCECHMCIGPAISSTVRMLLFLTFVVNIALIIYEINLQINKNDAENMILPLENPFPQLTNGFLGKKKLLYEISEMYTT